MNTLFRAKFLLILACGLFLAGAVSAQVIIYQDDFSGAQANLLNGTTPDVTIGANTWTAGTEGNVWNADGSFFDNAGTAHLPFTIASGNIYELSANMTVNSGAGAMLQFGNGNVFGTFNLLAIRVDGAGGANVNVSFSSTGLDWNNGWSTEGGRQNIPALNAPNGQLAKIVLDTNPTDWAVSYYYNDTLLGSNFIDADERAALTNAGVGFASTVFSGGITGNVDNFQLAIVPESSTGMLVLAAAALLAGIRVRRTKTS